MHRLAAVMMVLALAVVPASALASRAATGVTTEDGARATWEWPVSPVRVVQVFQAPAHLYGPGHRGLDLAVAPDAAITAPAPGVVAFAGRVVDRDLVTIDHGDGLVTTLEPVIPAVEPGDAVGTGSVVGAPGRGGHAAAGTVHFGVRDRGVYINPLLLLGEVPRAVLLPCC